MNPPLPFVRETGAGASVVCIHSNASSSSQWRALMDLLAPEYRVMAPDSYGSGKSPDWRSDRVISLADEVALIEPLLAPAQSPVTLVGHSYGAAVALKAALMFPARVRALALYEPTLFALVDAAEPPPNQADGIRNAVHAAAASLDAGDLHSAAQAFIDYWMGAGSWERTPANRRQPIAESVVNVRRWAHALFTEPAGIDEFRRIDAPVLYMVGKRSTASAHGVADILIPALPKVRTVAFEGLGHMGPITHPDVVNAEIKGFLAQV
ncbi:MAG TPA: alpha/beta hydrolase [Noviherbaspirillum sp.]|uniref:alpha/beta fold hydrolase n=1 Tax=Noviherbaspirillum sp. TaxID=1926288 RepID=UPI002D5B5025|nr:alpha/beta hydrolase [Noviherbaspirillum sp.]HYD94667.1 alpha/beta hydrolase [Noviherbaspirillum sp.]